MTDKPKVPARALERIRASYNPPRDVYDTDETGATQVRRRPAIMSVFYGSRFPVSMSPDILVDFFQPEAVMRLLESLKANFTHVNFSHLTSEQYQDTLLKLEETILQYRNLVP